MHERVNFTKPRTTVNSNKNSLSCVSSLIFPTFSERFLQETSKRLIDYNQMIKGTLMQIYYIFLCVFAHIKTIPENVAFLIVRILN